MYPFEERVSFRKVVIACGDEGCEGVFVHQSQLSDESPRVEENCSQCGRFISRKLSNIDEASILNVETIL